MNGIDTGIAIQGLCGVLIAIVVVAWSISLYRKLAEAPEEAGSRTMAILAEERGKTIQILMNQIKGLGEDYRKVATELKETTGDFERLQDLAIWMTGCGYDFTDRPYYMDMKFLMTKGIEVDPKDEIVEEPEELKEVKLTPKDEALAELMALVSCPLCKQPTSIAFVEEEEGYRIVEPRYCPACGWKAQETIEPILAGSDKYHVGATKKTGWGQEED